jgi:hypothetical protein
MGVSGPVIMTMTMIVIVVMVMVGARAVHVSERRAPVAASVIKALGGH